jgi:hypothetical protein
LSTNVTSIAFEHVTAVVHHKRDIDVYEDGCINYIELNLTYGDGCHLKAVAQSTYTDGFGLDIQAIEFSADSQCPEFPDHTEGVYKGTRDEVVGYILSGVDKVPNINSAESCVDTTWQLTLSGSIYVTVRGATPRQDYQI